MKECKNGLNGFIKHSNSNNYLEWLDTLHHFDLNKIDNSATAPINGLGGAVPPVSTNRTKVICYRFSLDRRGAVLSITPYYLSLKRVLLMTKRIFPCVLFEFEFWD